MTEQIFAVGKDNRAAELFAEFWKMLFSEYAEKKLSSMDVPERIQGFMPTVSVQALMQT